MFNTKAIFILLIAAILLVTGCGKKTQATPPLQGNTSNLASEFVELLNTGDYTAAEDYFDSTMKKQLPEAKLQEIWETIVQQAGSYQVEANKKTERIGQFEAVVITARFTQAYLNIRITFNQDNHIVNLYFLPAENPNMAEYMPPAYSQPANFTEKEVTVGVGEWALPGTLTMPTGSGPFPAVILVHGSGPNDRDESIGPNKPFKDLAAGLANQGIAVLRYDKRTKVHSAKIAGLPEFTVKEESIDDALAAFDFLQNTEKINTTKIFIAGHSLGGTLAPRIGIENNNIAGLVILAGAARPLEDLVLEQSHYLAEIDGTITEQEQAQLDLLEEHVRRIKDPELSMDTPANELFNAPASYWLDLRNYSPTKTADKLLMPILVLQGERDYQVTMEDFLLWQEAISTKNNVTLKSYSDLNHLFITGEKPSVPAEYEEPGNVAKTIIDDINVWVRQH